MAGPFETEYGGLVNESKDRRRKKRNPIPTAPSRPGGLPKTTPSGGSSGPVRTKAATGDPSAGGGASSAESRAIARENQAKQDAADRYMRQVQNLEAQARALKHALRVDFRKGLDQQLSDIADVLGQQQRIVREGYLGRSDQLAGSAEDNEKAVSGQTIINIQNQIRERNSAVGEAMNLGAGESDVLRAQMMSLRNWNANQTEVQRGYFDSLRSINSSLTDLNIDTKTALANNEIQANADREQLWTNYYGQRSEAFTQLGNIRGQQADYLVMAAEMGEDSVLGGKDRDGGKKGGRKKKADPDKATRKLTEWGGGRTMARAIPVPGDFRGRGSDPDDRDGRRRRSNGPGIDTMGEARRASEDAFMSAARMTGRSWDNPGISRRVMNWDGRDEFEATATSVSRLRAAPRVTQIKGPEGATLRKWNE